MSDHAVTRAGHAGSRLVALVCRAPNSVFFRRLWSLKKTFSEKWSSFGLFLAEKFLKLFFVQKWSSKVSFRKLF